MTTAELELRLKVAQEMIGAYSPDYSAEARDFLDDDVPPLLAAFRQACMNLATHVGDPESRDLSIGEIANLYEAALLAGWGGILGWPAD